MLSVLAGIVVLTVASFAIEAVLNPLLLWVFPEALPGPEALSSNPWVRTLMFAYGLMCVAAGGYVTAWIARRLPVQHAAAMGIIQLGLTIVAMLSSVANHASRWVWIVTAILTIPAALVGGVVYKRRKPNDGLAFTPSFRHLRKE
jgi:MFS family permease